MRLNSQPTVGGVRRPASPVLLGFRWSGYQELSDSEPFYSPKPVMINLRRRNHRPFVACFCEHWPVSGVLRASPKLPVPTCGTKTWPEIMRKLGEPIWDLWSEKITVFWVTK